MKLYFSLCIGAVLLLGTGMIFSDTLHCQQGERKFIVLFSHNLRGNLEPCG